MISDKKYIWAKCLKDMNLIFPRFASFPLAEFESNDQSYSSGEKYLLH